MANQIVKTTRAPSLRDKLDSIENATKKDVVNGYYDSRLKCLLSFWDMGEAIDVVFRGAETTPSYRELERQTGRGDDALKKWHKIYLKYETKQLYLPIAKVKAMEWTQRALGDGSPHVAQNSGISEWYTPQEYIDAAREVMGSIDTDPATTEVVNKRIKARCFYTIETDGLSKKWKGAVWMNPPYAQPLVSQFCGAFASKYRIGEITQGIVLVNNVTETVYAQELMCVCSGICFPSGRVPFLDINGKPGAPLQGQMLIYCGPNSEQFNESFSLFGVCLWNAAK